MRNLLQNGPGYRPPLSWSARQAKEKRRKDMLHLQQWLQASLFEIIMFFFFSIESLLIFNIIMYFTGRTMEVHAIY
jgi:hypothetical protein